MPGARSVLRGVGCRLRALAAAMAVTLFVAACPAVARAAQTCSNDAATFDPGLISAARAREQAGAGIATLSDDGLPSPLTPTSGHAHMLCVLVEFPDMPFSDTETEEVMQAQMGDGIEGMDCPSATIAAKAPYESVSAYYGRSSYGALAIESHVVSYEAAHERDHYTSDVSLLIREVMEGLDGSVDFSRYDANGDGYIDGVYLMFSGDVGAWASTWWPSMHNVQTLYPLIAGEMYDGELLGNLTLANRLNGSTAAVTTLIHETGHMLGLPDYYSYSSASGGEGNRGIGTTDMMFDSSGDHDAFSKWLLGWIGEENVTRVVVGAGGLTVKRGTAEPEHVDGPADVAVRALASEDASEGGGFLAVSADPGILGEKGLFTSFYLVQYDQAVGNQLAGATGLANAFRVYRVQAELTEDGSDFVKTNAFGSDNDKLIECLDPTGLSGHGVSAKCQLTLGDRITPATSPSTNFRESRAAGFTGIDLTVSRTGGAAGEVSVAYDGSLAPDPKAFWIADGGCGMLARGPYVLGCAYTPEVNGEALLAPTLLVDGEEYGVSVTVTSAGVSLDYELAPGVLRAGSTCEVVFPAGYFVLGTSSGEPVTSGELRVPLKVGPVAELARVDVIGSAAESGALAVTGISNVERLADGRAWVAQTFEDPATGNATLKMTRVEASDLSRSTTVRVTGADLALPSGTSQWSLTLVALDDGTVVLAAKSSEGVRLVWLDLAAGTVRGQTEVADALCEVRQVGDSCVLVRYDLGAVTVGAYALGESGIIEARFVTLAASSLLTGHDYVGVSSGGAVGYAGDGAGEPIGAQVRVMPADWLCDLLRDGYASEKEAKANVIDPSAYGAVAELPLPATDAPVSLASSGSTLLLLSMGYSTTLSRQTFTMSSFDLAGAPIATVELGGLRDEFALGVPELVAGQHGAAAVVFAEGNDIQARRATVLLRDSSLAQAGVLQDRGGATGAWADGSWVGVCSLPATREGTSNRLRGVVTAAIDVEKGPDDPTGPAVPTDPKTEPKDPDGPEGPASPDPDAVGRGSGTGVPATGDDAMPAVLPGLLACGGVALLALRRRASGER